MTDLERYFRNNTGRLIHKWDHYFHAYDRHFAKFRNQSPVVVEIGVFKGGSLQMWKNYFGAGARIFGIDVNPTCKSFEEDQIRILIGSQTDRAFLSSLRTEIPPIDILIDDGGHRMKQQIMTFEELFGHVKDGGVYLCEDTHTSYWLRYGGGVRRKGTFVEFSKRLIDQLNAWHSEQQALFVDSFTRSAGSLHFYDSLCFIEKSKRERPRDRKTGVDQTEQEQPAPDSLCRRLRRGCFLFLNMLLRTLRLPGVRTDALQRYDF